jgi:tetratricopeptide (TPR) repeat protein
VRSIASIILCAGCAQALHNPPPIEAIGAAPRASAAQLLADADAAWARRGEPEQAAAAEDLYLQAARADPRNPGSFAGAIRAKAFRIGREKDGAERTRLAESAVITGQLCQENAPTAPACDYWLAAALGLQARERSATGHDALPRMVDLLRRAIRTDPAIDQAGPHRLLAIVLLRAPGWPMGPGDAEAALPEAQAAARAAPEFPPNQLALGEALKKNGRTADARTAYSQALRLATEAAARGDPDAKGWVDDASAALR